MIGIVAGSLGGCTVPLQFFLDAMRTVSQAVPHSWAVDAWDSSCSTAPAWPTSPASLAVLAAFAAASWRWRRC
ncbi:MAG: hypothetical protein R2755_27315 [Acidimicrobiales bacterium]